MVSALALQTQGREFEPAPWSVSLSKTRVRQFSTFGGGHFSTDFQLKNDRVGHFSMGVYFQRYTGGIHS